MTQSAPTAIADHLRLYGAKKSFAQADKIAVDFIRSKSIGKDPDAMDVDVIYYGKGGKGKDSKGKGKGKDAKGKGKDKGGKAYGKDGKAKGKDGKGKGKDGKGKGWYPHRWHKHDWHGKVNNIDGENNWTWKDSDWQSTSWSDNSWKPTQAEPEAEKKPAGESCDYIYEARDFDPEKTSLDTENGWIFALSDGREIEISRQAFSKENVNSIGCQKLKLLSNKGSVGEKVLGMLDSRSTVTCAPPQMFPSSQHMQGRELAMHQASGTKLDYYGQKRVKAKDIEIGEPVEFTVELLNVTKFIISATDLNRKNTRVMLDGRSSYMEKRTRRKRLGLWWQIGLFFLPLEITGEFAKMNIDTIHSEQNFMIHCSFGKRSVYNISDYDPELDVVGSEV